MKLKYAVGALVTKSAPGKEDEVSMDVQLVEASSKEEALGIFFCRYLNQDISISDFNIKGEGIIDYDAEVVEFLKAGNKINAVKRLRDITSWGLIEAKDYVNKTIIPDLKKRGILKNEEYNHPAYPFRN